MSGVGVKVEATATNPKGGMTFAELRAFVTAGMRNNVADEAPVSARVSLGGKLKQVEVAGPGPDEGSQA
jgi:hypothetical protein